MRIEVNRAIKRGRPKKRKSCELVTYKRNDLEGTNGKLEQTGKSRQTMLTTSQ